MPLGPLIWVHVGQTTNCTLGGPPKEDGSPLGQEMVPESDRAGRAGHPHAVLQESAGLILGLCQACPRHSRTESGERGSNGPAPEARAR